MKRSLKAVLLAVALAATPIALAIPASAANTLTMLGADVSTLQRSLDLGAKYYNASGAQQDPYDILKSKGVNYARLRIWNNPPSGYNNKAKVLQQARAIKPRASSC